MTKDKYSSIGQFIKERREELGLTQQVLADQIGVMPATLSLYESGNRNPDLNRLAVIADKLHVPMATLLDIEIPEADIDIALRAQGIVDRSDVADIKKHIQALKYMRGRQKDEAKQTESKK